MSTPEGARAVETTNRVSQGGAPTTSPTPAPATRTALARATGSPPPAREATPPTSRGSSSTPPPGGSSDHVTLSSEGLREAICTTPGHLSQLALDEDRVPNLQAMFCGGEASLAADPGTSMGGGGSPSTTDPQGDPSRPGSTPPPAGQSGYDESQKLSIQDRNPDNKTPIRFRERLENLDLDKDGKVTQAELEEAEGVDKEEFKRLDLNGDGRYSLRELRREFHRQNSFSVLDKDGDGALSTEEMDQLERYDRALTYDADQDGRVTSEEFLAARRKEMHANRRAWIEERMSSLTEGEEKTRLLEKYDADKDGQITVDEYLTGWRAARDARNQSRTEELFKMASPDGQGFTLEDREEFASYDTDQDGKVSAAEFQAGREADRARLLELRYLGDPAAEEEIRERLGLDAVGNFKPIPSLGGTIELGGDVGSITYEQAANLIRSQGLEVNPNGEPSILAVRTRNAATKQYEDHFLVLKPNGEMQAFEATTRPSFSHDTGDWTPGMITQGNYRLTPRWKDHKWFDAFVVRTADGKDYVPFARDRDGSGTFDADEIANPSSSNMIRLHRGNESSGTTSSAGCLNVKDYDAFIRFLGGSEVSFNLTVVDAY